MYQRKRDTLAQIGAGLRISVGTEHAYVHAVIDLLAHRAPGLTHSLREADAEYLLADVTLAECDRVGDGRADYSGKHRRHGVNLQVITDPRGEIVWISHALPGRTYDLTADHIHRILTTCVRLGIPALAATLKKLCHTRPPATPRPRYRSATASRTPSTAPESATKPMGQRKKTGRACPLLPHHRDAVHDQQGLEDARFERFAKLDSGPLSNLNLCAGSWAGGGPGREEAPGGRVHDQDRLCIKSLPRVFTRPASGVHPDAAPSVLSAADPSPGARNTASRERGPPGPGGSRTSAFRPYLRPTGASVGATTAYRYIAEAIDVLASLAPTFVEVMNTAFTKAFAILGRHTAADRLDRGRPALLLRHTQEARHERTGDHRSGRATAVGLNIKAARSRGIINALEEASVECWTDSTVRLPYWGRWESFSAGQQGVNR